MIVDHYEFVCDMFYIQPYGERIRSMKWKWMNERQEYEHFLCLMLWIGSNSFSTYVIQIWFEFQKVWIVLLDTAEDNTDVSQ
jgi:hypothetical protein